MLNQIYESLFSQFQVSYKQLLENEFVFAYKMHITPNIIDDMEFFRVEYLIENYNEEIKRQNEAEAKRAAEEKRQSDQQERKMKSDQAKYKTPKK